MKKVLFFSFFILFLVSACKKEESDSRDKYVGVWKVTKTYNIPSLSILDIRNGVYTISKSSIQSDKILFMSSNSSDILSAIVKGDAYSYESWSYSDIINGEVYLERYTGNGHLYGNTINESGTININYFGIEYPGTWTATFLKQ